MQESEVYAFLQEVFTEVFGRSDIKLNHNLSAKDVVGWDSFKQVEIVLALEEKFDIRIRTKDLNEVEDVGGLVALVLNKVDAVT